MPLIMSSRALNHNLIPGLERLLTSDDLRRACNDHNTLPGGDALSKVENKDLIKHVDHLCSLIKDCNAQDIFVVHIPHRHIKVPHGCHLAGQTRVCDGRHYYWTKIVADENLNPEEVCGRKFVFDSQQGLRPYEFHQGPLPDLRNVTPEFFPLFANYLIEHNLTSTLGLQLIVPELLAIQMLEFVVPRCGLLLVEIALSLWNESLAVATSWGYSSDPTATSLPKYYCKKIKDTIDHEKVVITNSNPSIHDIIRSFRIQMEARG